MFNQKGTKTRWWKQSWNWSCGWDCSSRGILNMRHICSLLIALLLLLEITRFVILESMGNITFYYVDRLLNSEWGSHFNTEHLQQMHFQEMHEILNCEGNRGNEKIAGKNQAHNKRHLLSLMATFVICLLSYSLTHLTSSFQTVLCRIP